MVLVRCFNGLVRGFGGRPGGGQIVVQVDSNIEKKARLKKASSKKSLLPKRDVEMEEKLLQQRRSLHLANRTKSMILWKLFQFPNGSEMIKSLVYCEQDMGMMHINRRLMLKTAN